jgi:uncharacterized protein (TIGR03066 family)
MLRKTVVSLWVVLMITVAFLTACGKKNPLEKQIIGSWKGQFQEKTATFDFNKGGEMILHAEINSSMVIALNGTYRLVDDDTLSFQVTYNTQTFEGVNDIVIEDDQMTLTNPDTGETQVLTRVE